MTNWQCHLPLHHGEEYDSCASNQVPWEAGQAIYIASAWS